MQSLYPTSRPETLVLFDLRIPGIAERLHRERTAWQEYSDIDALDKDHFALVIYAGDAGRLAG